MQCEHQRFRSFPPERKTCCIALTVTEQRYVKIEKKMLAVIFTLEKFKFNTYAYGWPVAVYSDHKLPDSVLKKPITCASLQLQRMMMRLQKYGFRVSYKQGKHMYLTDTLSWAHLASTEQLKGAEFEVVNNASCLPMSTERTVEIHKTTEKDEALQVPEQNILQGWPDEWTGFLQLRTIKFKTLSRLINAKTLSYDFDL